MVQLDKNEIRIYSKLMGDLMENPGQPGPTNRVKAKLQELGLEPSILETLGYEEMLRRIESGSL